MKLLIVSFMICLKIIAGIKSEVNSHDPNHSCTALERLVNLTRRAGTFTFTVHTYKLKPSPKWAKYAKELIRNGKSGTLKNIDEKEVDNLFNPQRIKCLEGITLIYIEFAISGPDLFTDKKKWTLVANGEKHDIKAGESFNMLSRKPVMVSKEDGSKIQFILGSKFWKTINVHPAFAADSKKNSKIYYLTEPALDFILKGDKQEVKYGVFLHGSKVVGKQLDLSYRKAQEKSGKLFAVIRAMSENMIKQIQKSKPKVDLGLDYEYSSKTAGLSLNDHNIYNFMRRWVKVINPKTVLVDLDRAVKQFLRNSDILTTYGKKGNDHHLKEVEGSDQNLFGDKFKNKHGLSAYPSNSNIKPINDADKKLNEEQENTIKDILKKLEKDGLREHNIPEIENFVLKSVKNMHKNHRRGLVQKFEFQPSDFQTSHFKSVKFRSARPALGPPYGILESHKTDDETTPFMPIYKSNEETTEPDEYALEPEEKGPEDCSEDDFTKKKKIHPTYWTKHGVKAASEPYEETTEPGEYTTEPEEKELEDYLEHDFTTKKQFPATYWPKKEVTPEPKEKEREDCPEDDFTKKELKAASEPYEETTEPEEYTSEPKEKGPEDCPEDDFTTEKPFHATYWAKDGLKAATEPYEETTEPEEFTTEPEEKEGKDCLEDDFTTKKPFPAPYEEITEPEEYTPKPEEKVPEDCPEDDFTTEIWRTKKLTHRPMKHIVTDITTEATTPLVPDNITCDPMHSEYIDI